MKLLDYYYFVVLRLFDYLYKKDKLFYRATGIVSFTLTFNLYSIVTFIAPQMVIDYLWEFTFIIIIIMAVMYIILDRIYNSKRRESLREQYKDESEEERKRGAAFVALYVILSIVLLILSVWLGIKGCK